MTTLEIELPDESATHSVGQKLAQLVEAAPKPMSMYFSGPLGAGKTSLVRAMLRGLGVRGSIKSPSYALVEPYNFLKFSAYHFDFYRFFDQNEWADSGFREYFEQEDAICLVEWPEKAGQLLPKPDIHLRLAYLGDSGRRIELVAHSEAGQCLLQQLEKKQSL
ncbi:MAG TPA: tRNA (adenosine(37)-N6)-threonylcarbamoyltransferase complex ATPase subunit type 1 TsaE [Limnobacter sp.]|nr:tRNA (adenosine(37)-N6)-threonylcarbamoyltransferase complex ATPase subunit type 1 TsaE [Limnobacter sp.]